MDEGETLAFTGLLGLFGSFARFFDSRFAAFSLDLGGSFTDEAETPTEVEGGNDDEEDDDEEDEEMAGDLDLGCLRFDALEGSDEERIGRSEGVSKEPVPCKGGGEGEGVFSEGGICVPGVSSTGLLGGVSSTGSLEGSFVREGVSSTTEGVSSTTEGVSSTMEGVSSTWKAFHPQWKAFHPQWKPFHPQNRPMVLLVYHPKHPLFLESYKHLPSVWVANRE